MPDAPEAERRGYLTGAEKGKSTLLVLRRGVLRIFPGVAPKERHHGLPEEAVQLLHKSEVSAEKDGKLKIRSRLPYDVEHVFTASSDIEAKVWLQALQTSRSNGVGRLERHLEILSQGSTAYKYNYSNSKRMRRHFWVDAAQAELRWGKTREDESPQSIDLTQCVGIIFGPMTSTFLRCETLEDPPWCCFSLLFPDRTLDMASSGDVVMHWFLGLQHLLLQRSPACVTCLSEAQFAFRKVFYKIRHAAHRKGLTTRTFLARRLRALSHEMSGVVKPFSSEKGSGASGKADKRSTLRRPSDGRSVDGSPCASSSPGGASSVDGSVVGGQRRKSSMSFSPPVRDGMTAVSSEVEAEQEGLRRLGAELEASLRAVNSRLEEFRPQWEAIPDMPPMPAALKEAWELDGVGWQADKCAEQERALIALKLTNIATRRQLQASDRTEKQLKRLAKQYKDSEAQVQSMEQQLSAARAGAQTADSAKHSSNAELERAEAQTARLERRVRELQQQLAEASGGGGEAELSLLREQNKKQAEHFRGIEAEKASLSEKLQAVAKEIEAAERRRVENEQKLQACQGLSQNLVGVLRGLQGCLAGLRTEQQAVKASVKDDLRSIADDLVPLTNAVQQVGASRTGFEQRFREIADERKKLHNIVLELKGNIRVFVRVRPMQEKEKANETAGESTLTFAEDSKLSVFEANNARRKWFDFDKVFPPKCLQPEVFEEVKPLATSVLDGFNVCIFAYGQTGSGKTFTMTGNKENPGLNVRVLTELFRIRDERRLEMEIDISLMITEIYNETIKDLFVAKQKKLDVKQNPDGSNTVPGLTEIEVDSVDAVLKAMTEASGNRTVMATDMNEESSRSHSIVQVKTVCRNKKDKKDYVGKINLIDLAGSENVNKSGVSGQGMKEAQNINKSLSALGDVIQALVSKTPHIPYRNSKLTMMLKDSLGGDCKTLMIVQCSPAQTNVVETLSSLNFASRARNVELGKAKRNVKGGD